ncbi:MAG: carbohydrate kinase family protein [Candidatus Paceibacterota bacterium]
MFNSKKYDIVAIGDTVTDAFIKLEEAHVNCKLNTEEQEICMRFGDKIPYEFVEVCPAVGNSANAVISASRLGLKSAIITNIGDDSEGRDALDQFRKNNVSTDFVAINKGMKTNYHYVLWFETDRTILIKHEKFPHTFPKLKDPKWIYLSSLGENSLPFHKTIEEYLLKNPKVKLAFQPGTFQMKFGTEALKEIYKRADVFFCNVEEADRILKIDSKEKTNDNIRELAKKIADLGPKVVVLTDGSNGAYAYEKEKDILLFMPLYPDTKPPYERTGAGDAFASTFTSALIKGKTVEEALLWAPINAMSVVQDIGAQKGLISEAKLLEYLKVAPESYKPKVI